MEKPKDRKLLWLIAFPLSITVDLIQIILTFTGFGIAVNEALEAFTGPILLGLFVVFKVPIITKPRRIASLLVLSLGDAFTGGAAPFWVLDVLYIYRDVKREDKELIARQEYEMAYSNLSQQPFNMNGVRLPANSETPFKQQLNRNGIRPPNGGLVKKARVLK